MNIYVYFILGIILGISLATYFYINREEKIERFIESNKRLYSTKKLDRALENAVNLITDDIKEKKRELTEDEKNNIIFDCLKRVINLNETNNMQNEK